MSTDVRSAAKMRAAASGPEKRYDRETGQPKFEEPNWTKIPVDRKHLPSLTTTLLVRFMLISNEIPRLADASGALAGRMIILQITPEHMLHPVCCVKYTCAEALSCFLECIEQHALAVFVIGITLREERIVVEHIFVQSPSVLGQPKRGIRTEKL